MRRSVLIFKQVVLLFSILGIMTPNRGLPQTPTDTLQKEVLNIRQQLTGFEERITMAENDIFKLTKIKISGYIQAQWQHSENPAVYPSNSFSLRRARIKIKYQPYSGVAFVLEPNFSARSITLKDAYVQLNDPWINTFSLWAGQFKKLNYEIEVSSSQLDVLTRSLIVKALYPGERGLGAKVQVAPPTRPFQFELAVFNGNENMVIKNEEGDNINPKNADFDPFKDIMGRFVYHFRLGNIGGLDVGASGYYGWIKSNSTYLLNGDYTLDKIVTVGQSMTRGWFGIEMQLYLDFLGGMAVKGEYLIGVNAYPGYVGGTTETDPAQISLMNDTLFINNVTTTTSLISPCIRRNFMGGYICLVKNIGRKNKFAVRWDYYDPNTNLSGNQIGVDLFDNSSSDSQTHTDISGSDPVIAVNTITHTETSNTLKSGIDDIAYHRITLAWSYYMTDNITIQLAYNILMNEKVGVNAAGEGNVRKQFTVNDIIGYNDYSRVFPQNILTLRLQARF